MLNECKQKNNLSSPLLHAQNSAENTALCTYYGQVMGSVYNSPKIKEICKENIVDWLYLNGYQTISGRIDSCGTSFVHLEDSKGHKKYTRIHCLHEICPSCGDKNSFLHLKRVRRATARLLWNGLLARP